MLRNHLHYVTLILNRSSSLNLVRSVASLTPSKITELLTKDEASVPKNVLPKYLQAIECNQLASNSPIEDRLRISSLNLPGVQEPTLIAGVFDGHGGGTTADLISRRLFNYIAISLCPEPEKLMISNHGQLNNLLTDIHSSPSLIGAPSLRGIIDIDSLLSYKRDISNSNANIAAKLKDSFKRCDEDLSKEIQQNLISSHLLNQTTLHYYLSAAVSGCCALVMVIHEGVGYVASTGDCRAVLGIYNKDNPQTNPSTTSAIKNTQQNYGFSAIDLNDEHNCDNINEIKRLAGSHPKSEQNTMIRHNRLLGHLMPFRAFGDFNYKWPAELIKACGLTRAFGSGVIPINYNTPPYLIAEPDVEEVEIKNHISSNNEQRYIVIASDGLWELFESSRDVVETIVNHSLNSSQDANKDDYDQNCATHILRCALRSGSYQDCGVDIEELRRLYHIRLESTLTLSPAVVRNFRDDISIIMLKIKD